MQGAKGTALEWALALLRAPGERHALRAKPLPSGVEAVLGIAAGAAPDALARAAQASGEPEARVLEAARFYVREVLFFPGADAYRTLGVRPGDGIQTIKAHYRLLQHWLHPDRTSGQDDAVFAGRVNLAWNQLRTAERRQSYDQLKPWDRPAGVFASDPARQTLRAWEEAEPQAATRWRRRALVLLLFAICLVLIILVVRDMSREPGGWDDEEHMALQDVATAIELQTPSVEERPEPRPAPVRAPRKQQAAPVASTLRAAPAPPAAPATPRDYPASGYASIPSPAGTAAPPSQAAYTAADTSTDVPPPPRLEQVRLPATPEPRPIVPRLAEAPALPPDFLARVRQAEADARRQAQQEAARTASAHRAGEQLLRYMEAADKPPPPIWNSPLVEAGADGMRQDLRDWGVGRRAAQQWRFEEGTAALVSYYVIERGAGRGQVQLTADFVWRENRWLVTGVSMERVQ